MNAPADFRARRRPPAHGFALLEVLLALLLFSLGILGLLGLQAHAISSESDAQDRNRAALIADRCASQMQLQAHGLSMTSGAVNVAATLKSLCVSDAWSAYLQTPAQSGLPGNATLSVGDPVWRLGVPAAASAGGPALAPVSFDITVAWSTPARKTAGGAPSGQTAATPSQLVTTTTLLIQN
jgi:type IV pilus assembly protein PilV